MLPWLIAALAVLGAAYFALQAEAARTETESLRLQLDLRELELRDARNRREAERLLLNQQIEVGGARPPASGGKN
jgi:ribosomal protein S4E